MDLNWQDAIPQPVFDEEPGLVDLYREGWKAVAARLRDKHGLPATPWLDPEPPGGGPRRIADASFLAIVCKYAAGALPGVASLRNFYEAMPGGDPAVAAAFPVSEEAAAPLFAWAEYETALFSGDTAGVRELLRSGHLQRLYARLEELEVAPRGRDLPPNAARRVRGYHWNERAAGMAGSGRGGGLPSESVFWVDLLAQQCLAALCISRLAALVCDATLSAKWRGKFSGKKTLLHRWYWNEADSFYHDLDSSTMRYVPGFSPAAFWPFLVGCADLGEAAKFEARLSDPAAFGGLVPFPTLPRDDPAFDPGAGAGWRGSVRIRPAYVALRALSAGGRHDCARRLGLALLRHVHAAWERNEPHDFWECYDPDAPAPARPAPGREGRAAEPDRTGAGALAAVNVFLEHVVGLHYVDAFRRLVVWSPPPSGVRCGVRNLRFGTNRVDLVRDGSRIFVRAAEPFTLLTGETRRDLPAGASVLYPGGDPPPA